MYKIYASINQSINQSINESMNLYIYIYKYVEMYIYAEMYMTCWYNEQYVKHIPASHGVAASHRVPACIYIYIHTCYCIQYVSMCM